MLVARGQPADPYIISPAPAGAPSTVVVEQRPVTGGHDYVLHWAMNVEGEKAWRFRAEFAGITAIFADADGNIVETVQRHSHCYRTLGWQQAWVLLEAPESAHSVTASVSIVSNDPLPGRFLVGDFALEDLSDAPALEDGEALLRIEVVDDSGSAVPARIYAIDKNGEGHIPRFAYGSSLGSRCFYLPDPRLGTMQLPTGRYTIRAMKGFEYGVAEEVVTLAPGESRVVTLRVQRRFDMPSKHWWSGDHHAHLFRHGSSVYPMMNLDDVYTIAQAEGLSYLPFMGEDKVTDAARDYHAPGFIGYATAEETHDTWGHVCPIGVEEWPRFDNYQDLWPMNYDWIVAANDAGGAMAYAHPYSRMREVGVLAHIGDFDAGHGARGYPIDAALGARFTLDMLTLESDSAPYDVKLRDYMRLLNCGVRIGVSASTDFHVDQAREPIGGMRTYVKAEALEWPEIAESYREGRTFATNGPLVSLSVNGGGIGDTVTLDAPSDISIHVTAQSLWDIDGVELWQDGSLVAMLAASNGRVDKQITLPVQRSGWLLVIVKGPAVPEVMNAPEGNAMVEGQYAITSPVYLEVAGVPWARDPEAAQYFLEWIDVVESGFMAACARVAPEGSPMPRERQEIVLKRLETAREFYREHLRTP
ncbi:MAG: hypothetical protein AMXMBFR82_02540 [Candidatus Hydrogenedentota bacterium]